MTDTSVSGASPLITGTTEEESVGLKRGALGFGEVLFQAVGQMSPGIGIVFLLQLVAIYAGVSAPLAFLIGLLIVLTIVAPLTQLAKHLPSAGGYFTYVSRALHPRLGWLTAHMLNIAYTLAVPTSASFLGLIVSQGLQSEYGWNIPWWVFLVVFLVVTFALGYLGIVPSARVMLVSGLVEIVIFVALSIFALAEPGPGGVNLTSFTFPPGILHSQAFFLALVFAVSAYTGFESVAPLAEESRNPRRLLPIAMVTAAILVGLVFVFVNWAVLIGFGTDKAGDFAASAANPVFTVAQKLWHGVWVLVLFAILNSVLAFSITNFNSVTRIIASMANRGALPSKLGVIHPKYKTPGNALIMVFVVSMVVGLATGFYFGPLSWLAIYALFGTTGLILTYVLGNIAVVKLYRTEYRSEFNVFLHMLLPVFSSLVLLYLLYTSFVPLPVYPTTLGPIIFVVWVLFGVGYLAWLARTGKDSWMQRATVELE